MEEHTGIFRWNVKWHGKALTSVPSADMTSGVLIILSTRLLDINTADVTGYAVWRTLCFVVFYLLFAGSFTQMKRKDIAFSAGVTMGALLVPIILELIFPILSSSTLWGYLSFLWQWPISLSYPLNLAVKNPGLSQILSLFSLFFFVPFGKSSKEPQ